jgi:predicted sugar kinase
MTFEFRARLILLPILAASLGIAGGAAVAAQEPQKLPKEEVVKRAARLLDRAPVLDPLPADALSERAFMDEVERLLGEDVDNVEEAVRELEERLKPKRGRRVLIRILDKAIEIFVKDDTHKVVGSVGPITASIESVPSNLPVRYYHKMRPNQKLNTTTDKLSLKLDPPAIWVFECTNNGVLQTQVVSCATDCSVRFVF